MDVILLQRVEKLGQMGEVVKVKPGYARNYLLPQKKALRATKENVASFEQSRTQFEAENLDKRNEAEHVAGKLAGLSVVLTRQASDSDQLYGSVTTRDIADQVTEAGFTVGRRQVELDRPIKTVGLHSVRIRLHPEVAVDVTANVARSTEEAEAQARGERPSAMDDDDDDDFEAEGDGPSPEDVFVQPSETDQPSEHTSDQPTPPDDDED
jgi:large subunit ribosomal protein L9